jgi:hypothetical protein
MALDTKNREERNRLLVEWSTAVFAIFWGVWWAYAAESALNTNDDLQLIGTLMLPRWFVAIITALYVAVFTYFYVRWMWEARIFHWEIALRRFVRRFIPLGAVVVGLVINSAVLYARSELLLPQFVYGIVLTVGWVMTTVLISLQSETWL